MKAIKIITISVLSLLLTYLLYATIGYLVIALNTPRIYGDSNTVFLGMYIMSATHLLLSGVVATITIILSKKFFGKHKSKNVEK